MTDAEKLAWGAREDTARKADIALVKSGNMPLEEAQANARRRVRQSGMYPTDAHRWLVEAQRLA